MSLTKRLIQSMILAFTLGIYSTIFEPLVTGWLGGGLWATIVGFFIVIWVGWLAGWIVSRNVKEQEHD